MYGSGTARKVLHRCPTVMHFGVRSVGRLQDLRDRKLTEHDRWARRSTSELSFWADSLRAGGFADLLDPSAEVRQTCLRRALEEIPGTEVSILDVGSGPLTAAGHVYPGKRLSIVATDALASSYVEIMRSCGIVPPVVPVECTGENVKEAFADRRFDIAFVQNALDHSADPVLILDNMIDLVVPTGRLALRHFRNEGDSNGYAGLHFWNIDAVDGSLHFWNRQASHDVSAHLAKRGFRAECWFENSPHGQIIDCLIRPDGSATPAGISPPEREP